jgi:mono/diheme cytochrome c family protein
MPQRCIRIGRAALLSIAFTTAAAIAADMNGPMSSRQKVASPDAAASAVAGPADFDVHKLFANTCGWCHSNAGRAAGRGPKLMNTTLTDAEIVYRIRNGKQGAMPAFGSSFTDDQIKAIVTYIRELKPDGSAQ